VAFTVSRPEPADGSSGETVGHGLKSLTQMLFRRCNMGSVGLSRNDRFCILAWRIHMPQQEAIP